MTGAASTLLALVAALQVASHQETRVWGSDLGAEPSSASACHSTARTPSGSSYTYGRTASDPSSQYNGRVYDPGTGFHDYGARMYWPQIGRFISADSYQGRIEEPASLNRYSYVLNNPYKFVDPTGQDGVAAAAWAVAQVGSKSYSQKATHYLMGGIKGKWLRGWDADKCNVFVWDALKEGGDPAPLIDGVIPRAADWADPSVVIENYDVLPSGVALEPGDVLSNGHHMGIYAPLPKGADGTVSASFRTQTVVHNKWGFKGDEGKVTVRRFRGDIPGARVKGKASPKTDEKAPATEDK